MMNILLIKLGAMGDVLRTTPLLTAFKKKYPDSKICWLVHAPCRGVLEKNPLIDSLMDYSQESLHRLKTDRFDLSVNLDKEPEAIDAIMAVPSKNKMGFGRSPEGKLCALNALSDYAYRLGIDDDLKFRKNQKSYQEISFEQVGLEFNHEEYIFSVDPAGAVRAGNYLRSLGVNLDNKDRLVIGINTGSGGRFAGKRLPVSTTLELIEKFSTRMKALIFILGGQDEVERNRAISRGSKYPVVNTGSHPIHDFAAIVRECDLVISGDTTAMHIAIGMKVPVVAHFASTCASEIELYGRGVKVVSGISCAPCYKKVCPIDEQCMSDMSAEEIFLASKSLLESALKC